MSGVDLNVYDFDCDLTFCSLLMDPRGRILHTYGGRDATDAESHLSLPSLLRTMEKALADYAPPGAAGRGPKRTVEDMPPMARRIAAGKKPNCVHCHTVNDTRTEWARERGDFRKEMAFRWPDPVQVGIRLEKGDQSFVREVVPKSAAARLKLAAGDRLKTIGAQKILTFGDVSRALRTDGPFDVVWERDGKEMKGKLKPRNGWRVPTPEVFAWRPSKWPLSPKPGFGGPQLSAADLDRLGLPKGSFAFRIGYLVTWGPNRRTGLNARKAGLRKGDIVIRFAGKNDFSSMDHFHAWVRLRRKVGDVVPIEFLRAGKRKSVKMKLVE
jgi:hypothetical protein